MQGTFVNLCYTMENLAIATMMTYFGSTDHGLGTEVNRGRRGEGSTSSKNRLESPLIYIYIYIYNIYIYLLLLHNSSILDIEYNPYYIALGSTKTHNVI